jgi:hypothetical protein
MGLGSYFPEKEKPFVVKYNKSIQAITEKYSAFGNPFWQALKFYKDIYDLNEVVKGVKNKIVIHTAKSVTISFQNQSCSNITISEITCGNSEVTIPKIKVPTIKAKSNFSFEVIYYPVKLGEYTIPINIIM